MFETCPFGLAMRPCHPCKRRSSSSRSCSCLTILAGPWRRRTGGYAGQALHSAVSMDGTGVLLRCCFSATYTSQKVIRLVAWRWVAPASGWVAPRERYGGWHRVRHRTGSGIAPDQASGGGEASGRWHRVSVFGGWYRGHRNGDVSAEQCGIWATCSVCA